MPGCPGKTYRQVWQAFSADHLQVFCTGPECSAEWSKVCGSSSHKSRYQEVPGSYYPQTNPSSDPCDFRDLVSRAKWINSQSSLAAIDARQRFKQDFDARVAACQASANTVNNNGPSTHSDAAADVSDDAGSDSPPGNPTLDDILNSDHEENVAKAKDAANQVDKDIRSLYSSIKGKWKELAGERSIAGPLKEACAQLGEAFEMAGDATSENLGGYTPSITKSKDYVDRQADTLDTLAHWTPDEWLQRAGATSDPASFAAAEQQLEEVSAHFADMQDLATRSLPKIKTLEDLSEKLAGPYGGIKETSLVAADPIALGDMWSRVSGSTRSIAIIQSNIKAARSRIQSSSN